MADEITLYTNPMSRGRIVRWLLEEIGQPYRVEIVEYGPAMKSPEYLSINPMGKVPALRHGETIVTETAAICTYLADAFPDAGLAPRIGDKARGAYLRWMFFGAGPIEAAVADKALGVTITDQHKGVVGYGNFELMLSVLEKAIAGSAYLAGDRFSAADLYIGAQLGWGMGFGTIPKRPVFENYVQRLYQRPAHIRASELDDAAMPKPA